MKKLFILLSVSTAAMAAAPSASFAKLVLDLPPILAGGTAASNTCTINANCAGSTDGEYCCDGACQMTECSNSCNDCNSCDPTCTNPCTTCSSCCGTTCMDSNALCTNCCDGTCKTTTCETPNICASYPGCPTGPCYPECASTNPCAPCAVPAAAGLNDTGIIATVGSVRQEDADFGRDKTHNNDADGHAGFSFTKLDSSCNALADQTKTYTQQPWSYVKDNVTGLIWEIQSVNPPERPWYNTDNATNGGAPGLENGGANTQEYAKAANTTKWCGTTGWRMPTVKELFGLVNSSKKSMAADQNYFPNINSPGNAAFWSATPYAADSAKAWAVNFNNGIVIRSYGKAEATAINVMLVRDAE